MKGLKILIVEDELLVATQIGEMLEEIGYATIPPAGSYKQAIASLLESKPDIALLDIELRGSKTGIDVAAFIREQLDIPFIFLTSRSDARTVEQAKLLQPNAYLVKPITRDNLYTAIETAVFNYSSLKKKANENLVKVPAFDDTFFVKSSNLFHRIRYADILFAKSEHVYVEICTKDGKKHLIRSTLNDFMTTLPPHFFRVHRSYAINIQQLEAINSMFVKVGEYEIPISKQYRDQLMELIDIR